MLALLARLRTSGQAAWLILGRSKNEAEWVFIVAIMRLFPEPSPSNVVDFLSMRHVGYSYR